jgi:hypothetical protein
VAGVVDRELPEASVVIALAGCRRLRLGKLDTRAHALLDQAARICGAHGLSSLLASIDEIRGMPSR